MGQKVHPVGFRIGVNKNWQSRWYAEKDYAKVLYEDLRIRRILNRRLQDAAVSMIEIERAGSRISVTLHTAKPGMVIGKGGAEVEYLRKGLTRMTGKQVRINISEIEKPELVADLVAKNIAQQLSNRVAFRRAMKQALQRSMRAGAKGVRMQVSGRLGGADIARTEGYSEGTVPLHTLRADIDYGFAEAHTTYGRTGVKVWIYRGEILPTKQRKQRQGGA